MMKFERNKFGFPCLDKITYVDEPEIKEKAQDNPEYNVEDVGHVYNHLADD
jgi:hypothetical protein